MALFLVSAPASLADDIYPDIVGTWVGEGADIRMSYAGDNIVFGSETITQTITEQRDRRFTGSMRSESG